MFLAQFVRHFCWQELPKNWIIFFCSRQKQSFASSTLIVKASTAFLHDSVCSFSTHWEVFIDQAASLDLVEASPLRSYSTVTSLLLTLDYTHIQAAFYEISPIWLSYKDTNFCFLWSLLSGKTASNESGLFFSSILPKILLSLWKVRIPTKALLKKIRRSIYIASHSIGRVYTSEWVFGNFLCNKISCEVSECLQWIWPEHFASSVK